MNHVAARQEHLTDIRYSVSEIRQALAYLQMEASSVGLSGLADAIQDAMVVAEGDSIALCRLNF